VVCILVESHEARMIDIHCHILPGIDDGPHNLETSLEMCAAAAADGVQAIVATPHKGMSGYNPSWEAVLEGAEQVERAAREAGHTLRVLPGMEMLLVPELYHTLHSPRGTLAGSGRYVLFEVPPTLVPPRMDEILFQMRLKQLTPVLAHPERNQMIQREPEQAVALAQSGTLLQVTGSSLLGRFGPAAQECAEFLMRRGAVHLLASDAHDPVSRPPVLSEAVERAGELLGDRQAAVKCVSEIPRAILNGELYEPPMPEMEAPPAKSWWRRLLGV